MPAEHNYIDGTLRQGYFCASCGESTSLYGHMKLGDPRNDRDDDFWTCNRNPTLVAQLRRANPPPGTKPHYVWTPRMFK